MAQLNVEPRTVIVGDNLEVTRCINSECVDLIATDPPFNSNKKYIAPLSSRAKGAGYTDIWTWDDVDELRFAELIDRYPEIKHVVNAIGVTHGSGSAAYAVMMGTRIFEFHRVLKPTGSLFLHCNQDANFMLRILLDFVFGAENFRGELIWHYGKMHNAEHSFPKNHDTIYYYSKSDKFCFNVLPCGESSYKERYRRYVVDNKVFYGSVKASRDKIVLSRIRKRMKELGRLLTDTDVLWDFDKEFRAQDSVFSVPIIRGNSRERTEFLTQKPLPLYERFIAAASNEGDVVYDPFCGCGTTPIAAEKLNRKWFGCDVDGIATGLVADRMDDESAQGNVGSNGYPPRTRRIIYSDEEGNVITPIHRTDLDEPLDGRAILQQAAATNW